MSNAELQATIVKLNKQIKDQQKIIDAIPEPGKGQNVDLSSFENFVLSSTKEVENFVNPEDKSKVFAARLVKGLGVVAASYIPGSVEKDSQKDGEGDGDKEPDSDNAKDTTNTTFNEKSTKIGDL